MEILNTHRHTGTDTKRIKKRYIIPTDRQLYISSDEVANTVGVETIEGVKTFTSIPELPASDPTTNNEIVKKSYVDDNGSITETAIDTTLIDSADTERSIVAAQSNYTTKKTITFNEANGTITIKFDLRDENGAGTTYGTVFINDVLTGIEQTETGGTWTTKSEDFAVENGDVIKLRMKHDDSGGGNGGHCRNFRFYYKRNIGIDSNVHTVNTD